MYHEVTQKLAMTSGNPAAVEYSRAVPMGGSNAVGYEFWVLSTTASVGNTIDNITVTLQGSNDLSNWTLIDSTSTSNVAGPTHQRVADAGVVSWEYVRLHYAATSTLSTYLLMLRAGVELFTRS